jgi:hypothetical protein
MELPGGLPVPASPLGGVPGGNARLRDGRAPTSVLPALKKWRGYEGARNPSRNPGFQPKARVT